MRYRTYKISNEYTLGKFLLGVLWVMGFVVAKGFWSTLFCLIPLWAWYLSIEHILKSIGWF